MKKKKKKKRRRKQIPRLLGEFEFEFAIADSVSRGNLSSSSPPVRSHPDVEDRVLRSRRSAFCNILFAHLTSVAALKTLLPHLLLAVSLLFTVTFTIFLTVKSSEGPLWFLRATSTTPTPRSLTVAARSSFHAVRLPSPSLVTFLCVRSLVSE